MNDAEKVKDWVRYYELCQPHNKPGALWSVLRTDGERVLNGVLKELKIEKTLDLIKALAKA